MVVTNWREVTKWENYVHFYRSMSTVILPPQRSVIPRVPKTEAHERRIELRATVPADRRRIFDALTLPEYREAWLCFPCSHSNCRTLAWQSGNQFQLGHYVGGALDLSITGSYQVCRRSKMHFTWQKSHAAYEPENSSKTQVHIRLQGEFASSTLCLSHAGFFSADEYRWHYDMWQLSLNKLRSLF